MSCLVPWDAFRVQTLGMPGGCCWRESRTAAGWAPMLGVQSSDEKVYISLGSSRVFKVFIVSKISRHI
jgi:hypothetical protein